MKDINIEIIENYIKELETKIEIQANIIALYKEKDKLNTKEISIHAPIYYVPVPYRWFSWF